MKIVSEKDCFPATDIALASCLVYLGYKLILIKWLDSKQATFYIERKDGIEQNAQAFWSHSLEVDPLAYFNCLKEVKTRLYGTPKNDHN